MFERPLWTPWWSDRVAPNMENGKRFERKYGVFHSVRGDVGNASRHYRLELCSAVAGHRSHWVICAAARRRRCQHGRHGARRQKRKDYDGKQGRYAVSCCGYVIVKYRASVLGRVISDSALIGPSERSAELITAARFSNGFFPLRNYSLRVGRG